MATPRLIALAGPVKGQVFHLAQEEILLGRESSNRILISDLSTSRRHCAIQWDSAAFSLRDLDSFNGTFVNGLPVKERALEHGDRIVIGSSHFLFLLHDKDPAPDSGSVQLAEGLSLTQETIRLSPHEVSLLQPEKL